MMEEAVPQSDVYATSNAILVLVMRVQNSIRDRESARERSLIRYS